MSTHQEIQELLGAFALDAVDPTEAVVVESHLATCPRCRNEIREHREVASLLAYAGTSAPEGMWDRLAATLEGAPPAPAAPTLLMRGRQAASATYELPRRRGPRIARLVAAAAVVVALGAGGLQVQRTLSSQDDQIDSVAQALTKDASRARILGEAAAALVDGARQVHLVTPDRQPIADAVILANGDGYLLDKGAPGLPEDRTYQLWAVTGGQKLSLGLPGRGIDVLTFKVPENTDALALTVERAPGAVTPQNQAVGYGLVQR